MTPIVFNYKDYVQDNTINAAELTVTKTINDVVTPIDLSGAIIKCTFKHEEETVLKEIGSGITVTNPSGGVFVIDEFKLLKAGQYVYDVKIIFPDGTNKTWIRGEVKILAAVTL
jgi:hypothetical protein